MSIVAVANRKGGVGKSTIATMIAYSMSVWDKQRVLLVDLDAQCNASLILLGGKNWSLARDKSQTIADYFDHRFDHINLDFTNYLLHEVGDVASVNGIVPQISLVPGSVELEDIEHELLHRVSRRTSTLHEAEAGVIGRMSVMLADLKRHYPILIFDCPPGLSFATQAALKIANKIIVPFRPDYVSAFAVDRISRMIESKATLPEVNAIPREKRRYVTLANFVTNDLAALERIEDIENYHPMMETRIPLDQQIANAFTWRGERVSIETKLGPAGLKVARSLGYELNAILKLSSSGTVK
jgi:chromosome partitioning protein